MGMATPTPAFFTPSLGRFRVSGLPSFDWGLSGDVTILRNFGR